MLLRKDAKIELLRRIPLFADCTKNELQEIARITEERTVESGAVLIREGESGHEAFVVVDGSFEVSRRGAGRVAEIGSGDVVGEMALFSNRPRNATVTAVTAAHLVRVRDTDFLALLDRTSHLWLKIARSLADRVPEDERLEDHYRD
jgi:CRP-like cAMP-binding protein